MSIRLFWQIAHHTLGHGCVGLSIGRLWAWKLHDWTYIKGWPEDKEPLPQRWRGLE